VGFCTQGELSLAQTSRLPGFHTLTVAERSDLVAQSAELSDTDRNNLRKGGLDPERADKLIENAIGVYGLPIGIATNFVINGRDVLIPMVIEEPSVVAGASFMAKLAREGGGFRTSSTEPEMIGQIQMLDLDNLEAAEQAVLSHREELLARVAQQSERLIARGGGPRDIQVKSFPDSPIGPMLVVHLVLDCRDAMGANMVNTACEALAEPIERITGGRAALRILSNLADRRLATAECTIPAAALTFGDHPGERVARGIVEAWAFAKIDPYRAATHNKGIMNGIDPVVIATGNDWRAIEAGAHAYAARDGHYTSLSEWGIVDGDNLTGRLEIPMAVGIAGGTTKAHPAAQTALRILGVTTGRELAEIITAVGLSQNLAALRALATEGIQAGHMSLHARQIAVSAGATGTDVDRLAEQMLREGEITPSRAEELLKNN
jgi:hydroxymethylglutaryl-CoA reductase